MNAARLVLLAGVVALPPAPAPAAGAAADPCVAHADALLGALGRHDYAAAAREMDAHMRQISFPRQLPDLWDSLVGDSGFGAYLSHGDPTVVRNEDGSTTVQVPLRFARFTPTGWLTCDPVQGEGVDSFDLH
ncbi:hypothetical protein [Fulvimonas yonginensis]|uniref:DUF3887 domain-containing protein n=1 Tax=Fulvimonas yonginensis TaxID=1495200 RepID=A0ABU8J9W2_9GAMM